MNDTEFETRQRLIDEQLRRAGWAKEKGNLIEELRLLGTPLANVLREETRPYTDGEEFLDYGLMGRDRKPLAIVEAKRSSRDALAGKRQAADYAKRVGAYSGVEPFIFLANGQEIWFWDQERYPPRQVSGFFTPEDLERLALQRKYRKPLHDRGPRPGIAGRPYQVEAIRRVTEALERGQRKFLIVMATGTGKTRTIVALIDLLLRAGWAQRILFLADRRELVRQALGEFKEHLPDESRARIEGGEIDAGARIHVATYPSLIQVHKQLSPGYYDLIVADESHRSIYNRYKALFDHFDALQIGLTATPTDYIDHNTFDLFECPDGLPTFHYPYEVAVEESYLVPYRVLEAQTRFQLQGIKAGQIPPEFERQLREQGIEPAELDFEGSDLERRVTNSGTNDALVQEFMARCRKDATDTLPAKTILFALSHAHAVELWKSFNRLYPDLQKRDLAEIIDSYMERVEKTLDDFKRRDFPRVAITVDMLETGVDIPAVQNLVFAKPVFSQVKFWQMIGRGTRLWTDPATGRKKPDFLILDHWNNFAYFQISPEGETAVPTEPLPTRLFRLRLEKWLLLRGRSEMERAHDVAAELREMLVALPGENVNIRRQLETIAEFAGAERWEEEDAGSEPFLERVRALMPLLRFMPDVQLDSMAFEARAEQLAIAFLTGDKVESGHLGEKIRDDLRRLPNSLRAVQVQQEKRAWVLDMAFWERLDYARIEDLQTTFAPLMRFRQREKQEIIRLSLPDRIAARRWVVYGPGGEGAWAEAYREQAEVWVRERAESLPAIHKLRRGDLLEEADLHALADALNRPDCFITERALREAYEQPDVDLPAFLRHILGLEPLPSRDSRIKAAFETFLAQHPHFSAVQVNFVRTIRSAVLRGSEVTRDDLERPPFNRLGSPARLFPENDLITILAFANRLISPQPGAGFRV